MIDGERRHLRPTDPEIPTDDYLANCDEDIAARVYVYELGELIGQRFFDASGAELNEHGRPMRPRPPNIPPTSFHIEGQGWFWNRRRGERGDVWLEARAFFDDGSLRKESDYRANSERAFYANGTLRHEGQRATGASHHMTGTWRYYDRTGRRYLTVRYDEARTAHRECWRIWEREVGPGVVREGPIEHGDEVGAWVVRDAADAVIAELDLGTRITDDQLLDHAVCADELDDGYRPAATDRSLPAMLARVRRAGLARDPRELGLAFLVGGRVLPGVWGGFQY